MKKQQYIAPRCEELAVAVEQMLAASLVVNPTPGDGFGGEVKEDAGWNIWG